MMLAFSSFSDAHFHLVYSGLFQPFSVSYYGMSCAHDREEFLKQERLAARYNNTVNTHILSAFGMHPQLPAVENADFMESLLREKRIQAIGEAGFDLFTKEFKADTSRQEEAWSIELDLAAFYNVPIIIHCRKALDRMFRDSRKLAKISAVVFHSFSGSPSDARSLLRHRVNSYFSFGKPLIGGDKSAIACIKELSTDRLLMETDAPYQTLKNEDTTAVTEIMRVYKTAFLMQSESRKNLCPEDFSAQLLSNFRAAYGIV
jgi:TatD DNase family protein